MSARPPARRLTALLGVMALGFSIIAARLVVLQLRDASVYEAMARAQRVREIELPAVRGSILDRHGEELAISLPAKAVYANPQLIAVPQRVAERLARPLDMKAGELAGRMRNDSSFVYLARRVDTAAARRVARMEIRGIGLVDESKRYYPAGDLASQILGFVGDDEAGLAGLELQYEDVLAGRAGKMVMEQDPTGRAIPQAGISDVGPVPGSDVILTIDRDLQYQAQQALAAAVAENGARGGTVIVMDPHNGEILAMATYPWFDPNHFTEARADVIRTRAITDVYEPGSVNKVITAAGALEDEVVGLEDTFHVPDRYRVADKVFSDSHRHAPAAMTLSDIITESSNVGIIQVAQELGRDRLSRYLKLFGFGRETGLGFPGEVEGILLPRDEWWATSMGTIPMGQGIAVTPLQMASVYATIASGGNRVHPTLVRGVTDGSGRYLPEQTGNSHRVVSARTARVVRHMLARVVAEGTGRLAQLPGYRVAGKTGTARKPLEDARGYSDQFVASFMGFAPASDPRIVVAAILDEPATVYGGIAAAPLFREVARLSLAALHVPPASGR